MPSLVSLSVTLPVTMIVCARAVAREQMNTTKINITRLITVLQYLNPGPGLIIKRSKYNQPY